ncbi:MAG TPA: hypothetical protein VN154_00870 [Rhizomicrobium sp.]|nr:hypothetical protein [Rhizomicrobium sp.]
MTRLRAYGEGLAVAMGRRFEPPEKRKLATLRFGQHTNVKHIVWTYTLAVFLAFAAIPVNFGPNNTCGLFAFDDAHVPPLLE